jgi:predicted ATPase
LTTPIVLSGDGTIRAGDWACYRQAISVARHQQAKSLELRAAMCLARFLRDEGRRYDARDMLAAVYGWFTKGFDTPDLKDAKALLDEIR